MAFRAFVAVAVPPVEPLVTLLGKLAALPADLRVVEPPNLHFTLSFLGEVEDEAKPALADAIRAGAAGTRAFDVTLETVGAFPNARHPRVVWAGVADPRPLTQLALATREALARAEAPRDDKDFRAHLTLARVRSPRGGAAVGAFLREHARDAITTIRADRVTLYQSVLGPRGPTYTPLAEAPLEA